MEEYQVFLNIDAFVFSLVLGLFGAGFHSSEHGVTGEQKMEKSESTWNGVIMHHFEQGGKTAPLIRRSSCLVTCKA